jgi:Ca2+-binding RTX toxin-like protein
LAPDSGNIIFGDTGYIDYDNDSDADDIDEIASTTTTAAWGVDANLDPVIIDVGGIDTIHTGDGDDLILGGRFGDTINARNGDNIVFGDSGSITAATMDSTPLAGPDGQPILIRRIETVEPDDGGLDLITTLSGDDIILGGTAGDTIHAGAGVDIIFGDQGEVVRTGGANTVVTYSDSGALGYEPEPWFEDYGYTATSIRDADAGAGDLIYGEAGGDYILGQQGIDVIFGGAGDDDIYGGHNQPTGYDTDDIIDGGTGNDVIAGDNASIERTGGAAGPRFRVLDGSQIYGEGWDNGDLIDGLPQVTSEAQSNPDGIHARSVTLFDSAFFDAEEYDSDTFGDDMIAGGADDDLIFGQLGNDMLNGDGQITYPGGVESLELSDIVIEDFSITTLETANGSDAGGDDYIEGNGGADTIYGGLGQDDLIGGNSFMFGLGTPDLRPDGNLKGTLFNLTGDGTNDPGIYKWDGLTWVFQSISAGETLPESPKTGTLFDLTGDVTNDPGIYQWDGSEWVLQLIAEGETLPDGIDHIYGGNGDIDMLARNNMGDETENGHARDADMILGDNGNIYRLVEVIDTEPGGTAYLEFNYDQTSPFEDRGEMRIIPRAADLIDYTPGGADYDPTVAATDIGGADVIHGEAGDDFIYGMVGNDILFGEGQDDDIIGGWGNDWISGGTGQDGILGDDGRIYTSRNSVDGEPLYGIEGLDDHDPSTRYNNGTVLNEFIYTPGKIQQSTINVTGELKKSVNLTPFNLDPDGNEINEGIQDPLFDPQYADDIIYGGWGDDFLHGGAGDDAISGAEALPEFYADPSNQGDILGYGKAKVWDDPAKAGEFAWYDEYNPLKKILINPDTGDPIQFLLNFDHTEGSNTTGTKTDGNDAIFGDLGNDWLVGGTGRDHLYGGYGDDLLNADDNLETADGMNNAPDTDPTYEDTAYGGAGRDVLIANTGGDRLIDWAGEFNSYIVPFAPYGMATISRTVQPQLPEYLYALSMSDGVDMTRAEDTGNDPLRNGEPDGELGLVKQKDAAWQDQTGAPADPQAGNIAGGRRDVLRSASFNTGSADMFAVDSGLWSVESGRYQVAPEYLGGDALAVFNVDKYIPNYFEMTATIQAVKPVAGYNANAYLVFDYLSATDFKFAGINVSTSKLEIGYRDAAGWHVVLQTPYTGALKAGTDYGMLLALNGSTATLVVENRITLTHTFEPRVDTDGFQYFLNEGMVGIGANNAKAQIDNVVVQRIAPETTLEQTVEFTEVDPAFDALFKAPLGGKWEVTDGRYVGADSVDLIDMTIHPAYLLDLSATLGTEARGGFVFDYYGPDDYKFVALSVQSGEVLIGHRTARDVFVVDAAWKNTGLVDDQDYILGVTLMGNTVSVTFDNPNDGDPIQGVLSFAYNALVTDGQFGLLAQDGSASFDSVKVMTDDPAFAGTTPPPVTLPAITVSDTSVTEGDSGSQEVTLSITLSAAASDTVTVDYATVNGTAFAGEDYGVVSGTLTFTPGETTRTVTVQVLGDTLFESDETFTVQLSNITGATIADGVGIVGIQNDDSSSTPAAPEISIDDVSVREGDKANKTKVDVTVRLSQASSQPISVDLATADGTAESVLDYVAVPGATLTFAAGETVKAYTLTVNGDKVAESDEYFMVTLSNVTGGVEISDREGRVTIINDDGMPLTAAAAPAEAGTVEVLTGEMLAPIVDAAIERWVQALDLDAGQVVDLYAVDFQITDFAGLTLGLADKETILIDADAAGYGWFVDDTPEDDVEFADGSSDAAGKMDLLTVVMHEIGHVLGYDDAAEDADTLMSATLDPGERVNPGHDEDSLVMMDVSDLTSDVNEPELLSRVTEEESWLIDFLVKKARKDDNPFEPVDDFQIELSETVGVDE